MTGTDHQTAATPGQAEYEAFRGAIPDWVCNVPGGKWEDLPETVRNGFAAIAAQEPTPGQVHVIDYTGRDERAQMSRGVALAVHGAFREGVAEGARLASARPGIRPLHAADITPVPAAVHNKAAQVVTDIDQYLEAVAAREPHAADGERPLEQLAIAAFGAWIDASSAWHASVSWSQRPEPDRVAFRAAADAVLASFVSSDRDCSPVWTAIMGRKRGPLFVRSDRTRRAGVIRAEERGDVGPGQRLTAGCRRGAVRTGEHQIRRNSGAVASHEQVRSVVANKITVRMMLDMPGAEPQPAPGLLPPRRPGAVYTPDGKYELPQPAPELAAAMAVIAEYERLADGMVIPNRAARAEIRKRAGLPS